MTLFLQARCGSIHLLVDVTQVMEVLDLPTAGQQTTAAIVDHCSWREQILYRINMPGYFDMADAISNRLIVVDSGLADPTLRKVVLAVESSDSLLALEDAAISDIAGQHDKLAAVFAGVYSPTDSSACHLVLRFPATWITALVTGVAAA